MISKPQLIAKMRAVARRRGTKTLPRGEFRRVAKVSDRAILAHFDGWAEACAAAGLRHERNYRLADAEIFSAMREAFLANGGIGTYTRFMRCFRYNEDVLETRWPGWVGALSAFRDWALAVAPDFPHMDELERRIAKGPRKRRKTPAEAVFATARGARRGVASRRAVARGDAGLGRGPVPGGRRPMVGEAIAYRGMVYAPVNEQGVAMLFAAAAPALGFAIESVAAAFPDCLARRQVARGRWQWVRIEFEFESKNFRLHRHDPNGCDLIVCWEHNWPDCPIPVLELKREIARLPRE